MSGEALYMPSMVSLIMFFLFGYGVYDQYILFNEKTGQEIPFALVLTYTVEVFLFLFLVKVIFF